MTTIGGLFGRRTSGVAFTLDSTNMKIETVEPTTRHAVSTIAKMSLAFIKNPVHIGTFGSFRISIYDEDKNLIADVYEDIMYTVTTGNILDVAMFIGNPAVQKTSDLKVQFAPIHDLEVDAIIYIKMSTDLTIPCPTEFELNSDQLVQPLDISCDLDNNIFLINVPFYEAYTYLEGEHGYLVVTFEGVTNPQSAREITELEIETRMADGETVDKYVSDSI